LAHNSFANKLQQVLRRRANGIRAVWHFFHERTLRRRAVALFAAYVIALASLLATYASARAAGETTTNPVGVICHTALAGQPDSSGGHDDGQACANNCCIGCVMLMAALPPPPVTVTGAPQAAGVLLSLPIAGAVAAGSQTKSHRSRAPPLTA
jgi:hypothetical protein